MLWRHERTLLLHCVVRAVCHGIALLSGVVSGRIHCWLGNLMLPMVQRLRGLISMVAVAHGGCGIALLLHHAVWDDRIIRWASEILGW